MEITATAVPIRRIPWDIFAEIMDHLSYSLKQNPLQYSRDPIVIASYLQLCVSSKTLHAFAMPLLYSSITAKDERTIKRLLHALREHHQPWIHQRPPGIDPYGILSLALPHFAGDGTASMLTNVAALLNLVSPSLLRFYFDRLLPEAWAFTNALCIMVEEEAEAIGSTRAEWQETSPLYEALSNLPLLEEFVGVKCGQIFHFALPHIPPPWTTWANLVRLALFDSMVLHVIEETLDLEHLAYIVFANSSPSTTPDHPDAESVALLNRFLMKKKLRRVILVSGGPIEQSFVFVRSIWVAAAREAEAKRSVDGLQLEVVYAPVPGPLSDDTSIAVSKWLGDQAMGGTLWELEGELLASLPEMAEA